jgi:hypothetical protein
LQYTIHFINECDLFIRKLQQKYQLKHIPLLNNESCMVSVKTSRNLDHEAKIRSVEKQLQQQNGLPPPPSQVLHHSPSNDPNSVNTLLNDESSSSSTSSACSYTTTSSNSSVNASIFTTIVRPHQISSHSLPKSLIKTIQSHPIVINEAAGTFKEIIFKYKT